MLFLRTLRLAGLVSLFSILSQGGHAEDSPPWVQMDYGPFLSATIEATAPANNIANKGVMVNVGEKRGIASALFDIDLLRYAAGWIDGDLDWQNVVYDGQHGLHPHLVGRQLFGNDVRPGWSKGDSSPDPRPLPYGPLPPEAGRYRGLYLHGDRVIFSYEIGDVNVLDSLSHKKLSDGNVFERTLSINPHQDALYMDVCEYAGITPSPSDARAGYLALPPDEKYGGRRTVIVARGEVNGTELVADNSGVIRLRLPPSEKKRNLTIAIASLGPESAVDAVVKQTKSGPITDLSTMLDGGPSHWPEVLMTKGELDPATQGAFSIDTVSWPAQNPGQSWMRFGGFDFFKDTTKGAICTWSGDVWLIDGLDDDLDELKWRRIGTGLFQPLGLRIVDDRIYVCCRDQIVRLNDLNGDGETDFFECFNSDHEVTPHFHEFAMDLQTDGEGNFYYAKSARHALDSVVPQHGTLMKVSADGQHSTIVCNGFRAANGVGISPSDEMATSDQEGHWMPASRINLVEPDGFYGNMFSYHRGPRPTDYLPPVVWLPKNLDRSPAEQFWIPNDRWGPLAGKLLSLSYGTGEAFHVMYEKVSNTYQGAIVKIPELVFPTGIMRARFQPGTDDLYICGLVGWSSNRVQSGGFYRVRRTAAPLNLPIAFRVLPDGIELTFSDALDRESAENIDNYFVERWNYRWTENYGSDDYSVVDPDRTGHDELWVDAASLSEDGKSVRLTWEDQRPVMQLHLGYSLISQAGSPVKHDVYATINTVPKSE